MEAVQLGRSGLRVSPLCLGTMTFGNETGLDEARTIADRALDEGVFFWDTADMYSVGGSETMVGTLMEGRRDRIVLATKCWAAMGPGANDRGLSARHMIAACEASLRRLKTDWIDLYYLHIPDKLTPIDESLRAMEDLIRSGKVRYAACSNYRAWEVQDMVRRSEARGWQPVSAVQPLYNLVNRDIEVEMLPMCEANGLGVVTYSPLARGILTGKYSASTADGEENRLSRANPRFLQAEWRPESVEAADKLVALARERGCSSVELATAWAMANTLVTSVIAGPRTLSHFEGYLRAARIEWDAELEAACDAIVPLGSHTGQSWPDQDFYPITGRKIG